MCASRRILAPVWLPPAEGAPVWQEYYVAKNGSTVNGGFLLKPQPFRVSGHDETVACYGLPVSEGVVDPLHGMVGVQILRDAMARNPLLFCLGMGGEDTPPARLFAAMKWKLVACSFHFRVLRPARFCTGSRISAGPGCAASRSTCWRSAGWDRPGSPPWAWKSRPSRRIAAWMADTPAEFDERVDEVWDAARDSCSLVARRDVTVLRTLYPRAQERFVRLCVSRGRTMLGWAVLLVTQMHDDQYFGDLRVGTVVDCLALPGEETAVVAAATKELRARRADLAVSNQLHQDWQAAFDRTGYLRGPSNFVLAASPALAARLNPFEERVARAHMTRGDGDGPIHL